MGYEHDPEHFPILSKLKLSPVDCELAREMSQRLIEMGNDMVDPTTGYLTPAAMLAGFAEALAFLNERYGDEMQQK